MSRRIDVNTLLVRYDKKENDFLVFYPRSCDGALVLNHLVGNILQWSFKKERKGENFAFDTFNLKEELEKRGYDLSTLRFSIELKQP